MFEWPQARSKRSVGKQPRQFRADALYEHVRSDRPLSDGTTLQVPSKYPCPKATGTCMTRIGGCSSTGRCSTRRDPCTEKAAEAPVLAHCIWPIPTMSETFRNSCTCVIGHGTISCLSSATCICVLTTTFSQTVVEFFKQLLAKESLTTNGAGLFGGHTAQKCQIPASGWLATSNMKREQWKTRKKMERVKSSWLFDGCTPTPRYACDADGATVPPK